MTGQRKSSVTPVVPLHSRRDTIIGLRLTIMHFLTIISVNRLIKEKQALTIG